MNGQVLVSGGKERKQRSKTAKVKVKVKVNVGIEANKSSLVDKRRTTATIERRYSPRGEGGDGEVRSVRKGSRAHRGRGRQEEAAAADGWMWVGDGGMGLAGLDLVCWGSPGVVFSLQEPQGYLPALFLELSRKRQAASLGCGPWPITTAVCSSAISNSAHRQIIRSLGGGVLVCGNLDAPKYALQLLF